MSLLVFSSAVKPLIPFLFFTACQLCFAGGDTNIVAISDWSKPVGTDYSTLRARMIIAQEHSPASGGPLPETEFYLEFQNVTASAGNPLQFYPDPGNLVALQAARRKGQIAASRRFCRERRRTWCLLDYVAL